MSSVYDHFTTAVYVAPDMDAYYHGPVWQAFGLTRAAYFVMPRRALQSMPTGWQTRLVELMEELNAVLPEDFVGAEWSVQLRENGRFTQDERKHYRHTGPVPRKSR